MWRKLLKYRDKAKKIHRMEIRDGLSTSFSHDTWTDMGCLSDLIGAGGSIEVGIRATATVASAVARRKKTHRVEIYNMIEAVLENQKSKMSDAADVPLWKQKEETFRPQFSTKRTWSLIRQEHPTEYWYSGIWFQYSTPKYSFCTWLAIHNRLSTGDRMATWNSWISSLCIFCQQETETREHIFFDCVFFFCSMVAIDKRDPRSSI